MKLIEVLKGLDVRSATGDLGAEVTGVCYDSRAVDPGSVFVAIRGLQSDGNTFVPDAIARGAVAIVSENPPSASPAWVQVSSDRLALAALSSSFYGRPSARLKLIGITGTNGKTTTAHLVEAILGDDETPVAMLGTIDYRIPGWRAYAERTTPEAPDLERFFTAALDAGCAYAVMEVSSHAIALKRVEQLAFRVVAFTNLSGDHLDFHHTMEAYFAAKQRLFGGLAGPAPDTAVLNRDDAVFEELSASCRARSVRVLSYGMGEGADIHPRRYRFGESGVEVDFSTPAGIVSLKSALLGRPNLYNVAAAVGIGLAMEVSGEGIARGIAALPGVPGRFERIDCGQGFRVVVDYAHTDDALAKVLDAAREITPGRVIVVFGAGGGRDQSKRARMGKVAGERSEWVIVTSDNPRGEDPLRIIGMIEEGIRRASAPGGMYESIPDRREAIARAFARAKPGDTVVIAGKGHEAVQVVGAKTLPFDDRAVARELLELLKT